MQQLKDLQRHYNWKPKNKGAEAEFIRSEAFLTAVNRVENDAAERARLAIAMLSHVALDPHRGDEVEKFVSLQGEHFQIWLGFFRVSSIFGIFTVPRTSPEAKQLLQAIQRNLDGQLFKAAKMSLRLRDRAPARDYRLSRRASAAFSAELERHKPEWVTIPFKILEDERRLQYTQGALDAANRAKDAIYGLATERRHRREKAVEDATCTLCKPDDWYVFLTDFAMKYMRPESLQLAGQEATA